MGLVTIDDIKLIIWDLDETFWHGVLSEEEIKPIEPNLNILKELTNRGIVNSIASKNDYTRAKKKLKDLGIWEYFVFPSISWDPKGRLINQIIVNCQLRPQNVLFIDDNLSNLKEATYYNNGIITSLPDIIPTLLESPGLKGKDDHDHTRLKHYKILEQRQAALAKHSDNRSFLTSSNITVTLVDNCLDYFDRIHELLIRTNQLNFTKKRPEISDLRNTLNDKSKINRAVHVKDKYGDYGIAGFYSLDINTNTLNHFIFSCRLLNIGVEQYLYAHLKYPNINVTGQTAVTLKNNYKPDWITLSNSLYRHNKTSKTASKKLRIFFKGGCDLEQTFHYLHNYNVIVKDETNYVNDKKIAVHNEHTDILNHCLYNNYTYDENIPFIDKNTYKTELFECNYDILIYSPLMDYTQIRYKNIKNNTIITKGCYDFILTDKDNRKYILEFYKNTNSNFINNTFLDYLSEYYTNIGQISESDFIKNLNILRNNISDHIPIIFFNGAEVESSNPLEEKAVARHKLMNVALDSFLASTSNTYLLDIRKIISDENYITNSIRHYTRSTYKLIADELIILLTSVLNIKLKKRIGSSFKQKLSNLPWLKEIYNRLWNRSI